MKFKILLMVLLFSVGGAHARHDNFSEWDSYFANVNDRLSSIFLNLSLYDKAPMKRYPKLSWYWVEMKSPTENGLSSQKEYTSLIKHEDALLAVLADSELVYAGRITTQGRREFYFYSSNDNNVKQFIEDSFTDKENFEYQVGEQSDPHWRQYLNVLYPGENGLKQMEKDK